MASQKKKLAIIEDLSNTFIDENAKTYAKQYQESLNAIQATAITRVSKGLKVTQGTIGKTISISGINRNTRNAYVLSSVSLLVQHDRNAVLRRQLKPIANIMALYSVNNPVQFAFKIDKLTQRALGVKIPLNPRELKAFKQLDIFLRQNKKQIQKLVNTNTKALRVINKNISTSESKRIIKSRRRLINERIVVKGVKRPLTNNEIAIRLKSEFKDDTGRLSNILETEVHRQDELVKEVYAKGLGFKFKTWNNVGGNVRKGHKEMDRVKIPINKKFKVNRYKRKGGAWIKNGFDMMSQPGDSTAHVDNVARCKCVLTFSN